LQAISIGSDAVGQADRLMHCGTPNVPQIAPAYCENAERVGFINRFGEQPTGPIAVGRGQSFCDEPFTKRMDFWLDPHAGTARNHSLYKVITSP
jgi:hypothetical protein